MKKNLLGINFPTISFAKNIKLLSLLFVFSFFSNEILAQGATCASATPLTINGACDAGTINDATQNIPNATGCTFNTFRREGWYTFTVTGGPLNITITADAADRDLFLQLISSTSSCTGLTQINCANTTQANGAQTETITTSLANGTYYVKVINNRNNNDMVLNSICVTSSVDPCASATNIASCGTVVNTTIAAGTGSFGTSACGWTTGGIERVFTFTPATTGAYTIQQASSFAYIDYQFRTVASGCAAAGWTCIDDLSGASNSPSFTLTSGVQYYILLDPESTAGGNVSFTIGCPVAAPANDNCAGAIALTVNPNLSCGTVTAGTVSGATDSGISSSCFGTDDDDVWYRFVATNTSHYVSLLNVAGSTTDMYHAVYSGASGCGALGAALVCSDADSSIVTGLTIGQTYYVQIYSYTSTTGQTSTFNVCIGTPPPPPSNDNCGGAIVLTVNPSVFCTTTTAGTIASATDSGIAASGCFGTDDDDVWYRFVATNTSHYVSLLNVAGSTTDMYHAVYSGASGCGALGAALVCSDADSSTVTGLTIGQTYYVQVYSYTSTTGQTSTFDICIGTPPPPPGNDNCGGAVVLTVNPDLSCTSTTAGTIASATDSGIAASGCFGTDDDDVWYRFVATNTTHYVNLLNITGSTTDLYHAVYSGASGCGALGAALVCSDPNNSTVSGLTIGQTYYVQVYSYTSTGGQTSSFDICITTPCNGNGPGTGTTTLGCPSVVSGGLGLSGADPAAIACTAASTCVDLEATYLDLGDTSTYIVQSIPYNPPYQFGCLANAVSVNTDDVWSPAVNLPFNFCFYGNSYNQCTIGSNGILSFDMTNAGTSSGYSFSNSLPSTTGALFENTIYGVYHDINPGVGGEVGWELITLNTGCRALVASWNNVPMFSDNSILYTGMMVLYENTNVIEVYIQEKNIDDNNVLPWNDGNAIVGLQNSTGTAAVVAPNRNGLDTNWSATNEAWRFVPAGTSITSLVWHEGSGTSGPVIGTTDVINVCPATTTTYTAEITYTLCNGSTLIETEETTVTVNGSKVWNGSVSSNWNNNNNWTPVGRPTIADCVVIPNTANDPIVSGASYDALGLNLTIQNGAVLTVNATNDIIINDWVNINAGGDLQLNNSASLIQINNNPNTGTMHMNRTVNIRRLDYVYWSSPVASFTSNAISPGTSAGYIYKWIPTIGANINGFGNWTVGNENMVVGKGYIVRGPNAFTTTPAPFTATFTGTPNNGIITTPILRGTWNGGTYSTGVSTTLGTNYDDNWNLIGNPYPSAVNAISFLTTNTNIDGFIKIWTHGTLPSTAISDPFYNNYVYNYTPGDYITYNSSGTSSGPGVFGGQIASGQGFFVSMLHTSGSTSENVIFNNSMRNTLNNNSQFFRNSSEINNANDGRIWLDLIDANANVVRNLVGYIDGATNSRDRLFDAITDEKLNLNLYSKIGTEPMTIQGRTLPFDVYDLVPMGIKVPQNGNYSIGIGAVDGFFTNTSQNIYLEDLDTNIIHDLRQNPYSFTAVAGDDSDRFILRFTNSTLGNEDVVNEETNVWAITADYLSIKSTKNTIQSVRVFDVLGRLLADYQNVNGYEVPLTKIQKNNVALIIQVTLSSGTIVNKKVIY